MLFVFFKFVKHVMSTNLSFVLLSLCCFLFSVLTVRNYRHEHEALRQ